VRRLLATAVEAPFLEPVALALPDSNSASSSSSSSCNSSTMTAAAALPMIAIPAAQVQQLLVAGQRTVRVVVTTAGLPTGQLLLDKTWQLPTAAATAATASAEDAVAGKPMRLQLPLPASYTAAAPATAAAIATPSVLSVILLTGSDAAAAHSSTNDATGTAATAAASIASAATADDANALDLNPTDSTHSHPLAHVLAKLPLLVLPAAAAGELQQLYTALVAEGASCSAAYQQLLALLQDLAGVLVQAAATTAHMSSSNSSSSSSSKVTGEIVRALAAYFASKGMSGCLQLLPAHLTDAAAAAAAAASNEEVPPEDGAGDAAQASTVSAATYARDLSTSLADTGVRTGQPTASAPAGAAVAEAAAAAAAADGDGDGDGVAAEKPASSRTLDAPDAGSSHASSSSDSSSSGNAPLADSSPMADCTDSVGKGSRKHHGDNSSSSSHVVDGGSGADVKPGWGPSTCAKLAVEQEGFDARVFPATAFDISARSMLFGFPDAAVEAAYGRYKTCMMRVPCLFLGLLGHAIVAAVCAGRLVRVLLYSSSDDSGHQMQVHMTALRLLYPVLFTAADALVWAAGSNQCWQQQRR
jgi:hypothetical protein